MRSRRPPIQTESTLNLTNYRLFANLVESTLNLTNYRLFANISLCIFQEFDPDRPQCTFSTTISTIGSICHGKLDLKLHFSIFRNHSSKTHFWVPPFLCQIQPIIELFGPNFQLAAFMIYQNYGRRKRRRTVRYDVVNGHHVLNCQSTFLVMRQL